MTPTSSTAEPVPVSDSSTLGQARVAVVIPAYKVERQIERVVRGVPAWVAHVVVVVDASEELPFGLLLLG